VVGELIGPGASRSAQGDAVPRADLDGDLDRAGLFGLLGEDEAAKCLRDGRACDCQASAAVALSSDEWAGVGPSSTSDSGSTV
jgi:hypothetical protein